MGGAFVGILIATAASLVASGMLYWFVERPPGAGRLRYR
jgi:hypothetical protein